MEVTKTKVTDWHAVKDAPWYPNLAHGGIVAYRIHQRTDGLSWHQAHEWKHVDGTTDLEEWIPGIKGWAS